MGGRAARGRAAERRLIEAQIGRDVRGSVAVASRCRYGSRWWSGPRRCCPTAPRSRPCTGWPARRPGWRSAAWRRPDGTPSSASGSPPSPSWPPPTPPPMPATWPSATPWPLPGNPGVGGLPGRAAPPRPLRPPVRHRRQPGRPHRQPGRRPHRLPGSPSTSPGGGAGRSLGGEDPATAGLRRLAGRARRRYQLDPVAGGRRRRRRHRGRARSRDGHHPARQGRRPHRPLRPGGAGPHPEVLAGYAATCRRLGVERRRLVATSATRDAADSAGVPRRRRDLLGVDPRC